MKLFAIICLLSILSVFLMKGEQGVPEWYRSPKQMNDLLNKDIFPSLSVKERKLRKEIWERTWIQYQAPINFYGKILDENGDPVSKSFIKFSVLDASEKGYSEYTTYSNSLGEFKLKGITGKSLEVDVVDNRYYLSKKNPSGFEFGDQADPAYLISDPKKPIIFKMRKRGLAEPLISNRGKWILDTQSPLYIDLLVNFKIYKQKYYDQADLIVGFERTDSSTEENPEWTLNLEVPGVIGGLILSKDEYMFQAPKDGYNKKLVIKPSDFPIPDGIDSCLYLYLCSREGMHYARLRIEVNFTNGDNVDERTGQRRRVEEISIRYFMNPRSSTNLEYEYGNGIDAKLLHDHKVRLTYPTQEELEELRKEALDKRNLLEPDTIARYVDTFGD